MSLIFKEQAAPSTPTSTYVAVYAKSDGLMYYKDDTGTERAMAGTTFLDSVFRVQDNGDATKQIAFEASSITTGTTRTITMPDRNVDLTKATRIAMCLPCSDETSDLSTGTAKVTFRTPFAITLTSVKATVTTAPTGSTIIVDINETGTGTILSTRITIDATEKTSSTAAAPPVISDTSLADDAEITIDIDQVGSTIAGAGLKVWLIGYET